MCGRPHRVWKSEPNQIEANSARANAILRRVGHFQKRWGQGNLIPFLRRLVNGPGRNGKGSSGNGLYDGAQIERVDAPMNSEEPENLLCLKRCLVCGQMHVRSGQTCSRDCLMILATFNDFITLRGILENAHWAGARSQAELERKYLQERMWAAIRRLPHSEDLLIETLCEIIEDLEGAH